MELHLYYLSLKIIFDTYVENKNEILRNVILYEVK